jgi:N-acetylmuramoyl-L-alanine amidase-like protein
MAAVLALVMLVAPVRSTPSTPVPTERHVALAASSVTTGWRAEASLGTDVVGVKWNGDPGARFTISTRDRQGRWSTPEPVDTVDTGPDPGTREAARLPIRHATEPVWVRGATAVRVQLAGGRASDVELHTVTSPDQTFPRSTADAAVARPGIISRAQWGADEQLRLRNCSGPSYSDRLRFAVVHHTVDSNTYSARDSYAIVRGIYTYSVVTLGYCDMMYNFLVDKYGQIFEGRYGGVDKPVLGAHAIGFNTESVGVAMIGNYVSVAPPPVAIDALERLIAWRFAVARINPNAPVVYRTAGNDKFAAGTTVTIPTIVGHRDTWYTQCPGDALYALLPAIRANVAARVGNAPPTFPSWHPESGATRLLALDSWGGLYPSGGEVALAPTAYWPGWGIARGIAVVAGGGGGYVLDGYGGLHPFGSAPRLGVTGYWRNWDIARDVALLPGGGGGYVLDAYGGLHPFGSARPIHVSGYWRGWDIARRLVLTSSTGGYVLDGFGGLHPVGNAPALGAGAYWRNWDIARAVVARPGGGVAVLDGFGGVWAAGGPKIVGAPWFGTDVARGLVLVSANAGYVLRADGGIVGFGGAPAVTQAQASLAPPNAVRLATG